MDGMKNLTKGLKVTRTELQGSEKTHNFDDILNADGKEEARHITAIVVRAGYIMDAIGIVDETGKKYYHGNPGGGSETIISLENDSIRAIRGDIGISYRGRAISNLTIEMKSGKTYGPFGNGKSGNHFCLSVPENADFVGFYGNADNRIVKSLGLICCEGGAELLKNMMGGNVGNGFPGFGG